MAELSFYYARDYGDQVELDVGQIIEQVRVYPQSFHHVWQEGMLDWADVRDLPEIASRIEADPDPDDGLPYRHSIDGKFQEPALAEEIAARVLAAPEAIHKVWQLDFQWWPHAQEVPEIAEFGPLPAIPDPAPEQGQFQLKHQDKQFSGLTAEQIAAKVREAPEDSFMVWTEGMGVWLSPWEVESIVALGLPPSSNSDDGIWCLSIGPRNLKNLTSEQVAVAVRENREAGLKVWQPGMQTWMSPWEVDEIVALGIGEPPEEAAEESWQYQVGEVRASNLSREEVIERVREDPSGEHRIWQLGMAHWVSPFELPEFASQLPVLETTKEARPLLYSRGSQSKYLSPEEILLEIQSDPEAAHKVWPHMTERWFHPWEVEELAALGVKPPEVQAEEIWHYQQNDINHRNWTASQIAIAFMKKPTADHQVWQFGWQVWEDPRDVPAIANLLPSEED